MAPQEPLLLIYPILALCFAQRLFHDEYAVNIVILGPGAIGTLWAVKLVQAGHNVSMWSRSNSDKIYCSLQGQSTSHTFCNRSKLSLKHADLILVTVKAWQLSSAIDPLLSQLHSDIIVLVMHNGMGTLDYLVDNLPNNPLLFATTSHGAMKINGSDVKHTGWGETKLGALNQKGLSCEFLTEVLTHALEPVEWQQNIHHSLLLKLAVNCAINPLTALNDIKNGQLSSDVYFPLLEQLIGEICRVINAEGLVITQEALTKVVNKVITSTADNYSSMHQDIAHQRRTEIDFITGYLLVRAKFHNIAVPINDSLFQKIKKIEGK